MDGAVLPFLTVFLARERGLSVGEIGWVLVAAGFVALVAGPLVSMVADRYDNAKSLLIGTLVVSAFAALSIGPATGFWWILLAYAMFHVTRDSVSWALLDGIFFAAQRSLPALTGVDYHRARIWGTFGFMVPGVALYITLDEGDSLDFLPFLAFGLGIVGIVAASGLPRTHRGVNDQRGPAPSRRLADTARSARSLLNRPSTAALLVAMFLLRTSMVAFFFYYPLYAIDVIGLAPHQLGLVNNIGVGIELAYMAAFGWLVTRLGWRRLMIMGAAAAGFQAVMIAAFPSVVVLLGVQALHGLVVIVLYVGGRTILDRLAADEIRYTTQGLYAMIVIGGGRIAGSAIGGWAATTQSLSAVLWTAGAAAAASALLLALTLHPRRIPLATASTR